MLVWRSATCPPWLDGASDLQRRGDDHFIGAGEYPPPPDLEWVEVSPGIQVALYGEPELHRLVRKEPWALVMTVIDARGRPWLIPALLTPDGVPAVAQGIQLIPGQGIVRRPVSARAATALAAAQQVRQTPDLPSLGLDQLVGLLGAILEGILHVDAQSLALLGILDDVILVHGLRVAAGLTVPPKDP